MTQTEPVIPHTHDGMRCCLVTREPEPREGLVRFVVFEGSVIPDVAERLPGRGAWVGASRRHIDKAVRTGLFPRSFGRRCEAPENLSNQTSTLVERRLLEGIGIARKAGQATYGRDRCLAAMKNGNAGVLVVAEDAGTESKRMKSVADKLSISSGTGPEGEVLGNLFGVTCASFIAVAPGALAERTLREIQRFTGLRNTEPRDPA